MTLADDVNLEEFVMTKDEFSGADIKAICTEAGLLALRERRMKVSLNLYPYINSYKLVWVNRSIRITRPFICYRIGIIFGCMLTGSSSPGPLYFSVCITQFALTMSEHIVLYGSI
jgi:SpoVK/Ycf46/Vps4 family AAA+-type ATPase